MSCWGDDEDEDTEEDAFEESSRGEGKSRGV